MSPHPQQPVEEVDGILRFKKNAIVRHLLDHKGIDLNQLARMNFSAEDRQQFAQLIGYSLSGYSELSYVSDESYAVACRSFAGVDERDARIAYLQEELTNLKNGLRDPMAHLFGVHPNDLK
jgi:hypothetical protein